MRRGLAVSTTDADALIAAGLVRVRGSVADKPNRMVAAGDAVVIDGPPPRFVSRGGEKLDAALDAFKVEVTGRRAVDVGASTGGFTDCLLQRGAAHVVALDVGHGQLDRRIRGDERVTVVERTHVNEVDPAAIGAPFPLVVADVSFISLTSVAATLFSRLAAPAADVVVLVKPQFEVSKAVASKGKGVVTDPAEWEAAVARVQTAFAACGATMMGTVTSPITGASGNTEFLLHAVAGS
ncbi:MAG: rRNA (cytidine1920-2-O)/16S rRNA (cytidine1409-2-O)-methyltransferase [Actinomycetota bacterium]